MRINKLTTYWTLIYLTLFTGIGLAKNNHLLFELNELGAYESMQQTKIIQNFPTSDLMGIGKINNTLISSVHPGDQFDLTLPEYDSPISLYVKTVDENITGVFTFSGFIEGFMDSSFVLTTENNLLLGKFQIDGITYVIEPLQGGQKGQHALHRPNFSKYYKNAELDYMYQVENSTINQKIINNHSRENNLKFDYMNKSTTNNVKVLFLYANNVQNGNMLAANVVTEFNKTLERSEVSSNNRISAAGPAQLVGSEFIGQTRRDIINSMTANTGDTSDIEIRRKLVGADMVFLFIKDDYSFTNPRVGGVANAFLQAAPYGLSTDSWALGDYTAIHELGHMFGGRHQGDNSIISGLPNEERNHGVEGRNNWITMMGEYNDTCKIDYDEPSGKQPCRRLYYFSNPDVRPPRITWGEPIGHPQTADMESVLEYTMAQAATWGTQSAPPVNTGPVRGYSFDINKAGHGIHITKAGSGFGTQYLVYFYTFDQAGNPEWMMAQTTFANQKLMGQFNRIRLINGQISFHSAGSFTIDYNINSVINTPACDGVNRSKKPGVFSWNIDQQSGTWCLQAAFTNEDSNIPDATTATDKSGLWYEPNSAGWGFSYQSHTKNFINVRDVLATVYYYDSQGIGRWANGQIRTAVSETSLMIFNNLMHINGYPRTGSGMISITDIGNLQLNFGQTEDHVSVNARFPTDPQSASWIRNNVDIARLSY